MTEDNTVRPTKKATRAAVTRKCGWCGCSFETTHYSKEFCSNQHKVEFGNWCASRGKVLFPLAMAWRTARGRKGIGAEAMKEMVRFLDQCAAEQAERQAPNMAEHLKHRRSVDYTTPWFDRKARRPQRERNLKATD